MRQKQKLVAIALMCAFPAAASAQAAHEGCATDAELHTVSAFLLPGVIDAVAARCRSTLGARAFLTVSGAALSQRLRRDGVSWETASPVFAKVSRIVLGTGLGGEFASGAVVDQLIASALEDAFKTTDCAGIDGGIAALATLPSGRLVDFLATAFVMIGPSMKLKLCKAP